MLTKKIANEYEPDFAAGEAILIDKKLYKSSFDAVYKIRKVTGVQKVGHAGTLDPKATGLLIICTGRMTKKISEFRGLDKTYTGVISIGKTTPSFDTETEFDSENDFSGVTENKILEVRDSFVGKSEQMPPMFSALKKNGRALYQLARKGVEVEREPREIFISDFQITKIELPDIYFKTRCSTGTYIRVVASDFGAKLGCGAYLKSLRRTSIGEFNVEDAFYIEDFIEFAKPFAVETGVQNTVAV